MAHGRQNDQWNHTADLMALLANCHRDPKQTRQPFRREQFHPRPKKAAKPKPVPAGIDLLKQLFVR